jgi:ornithine carbamoyltransferase
MEMWAASPSGYEPNQLIVKSVARDAQRAGTPVPVVTNDPQEAVKGADVVYTDVWTSMGQEAESEARARAFEGYIVDEALMSQAKPDAVFMHCLPAHRGEEVAAGVIDGPQSVVFDEAENRLHVQKALMALLMGPQ